MTSRILAIETSSPRLSLAVGTDTTVLKEYQGPLGWRHAESLFDGMQKLLAQVRWPVQSLTGVLVSTGPGSFTGIRIGLAAARAIGQGLNIPVAGVPSLQTMAYGALHGKRYVCPVIDALREEVFTGLYTLDSKGNLKTVWKECRWLRMGLPPTLKSLTREPVKLVTAPPRAGVLIKLGAPRLRLAKAHFYQEVIPLYLRAAAAQERRKA